MNAKNNLNVTKRDTRINKIKEQIQLINNSENIHKVRARGKIQQCPIVMLDINIPIYRLENGRTIGEQLNYINTRKKDSDYFLKNIENVEAHIVQHNFLLELSKDPKANIYEQFKKIKNFDETRDPLLLTKDGTVINGNRRLADFRELFWDSPDTYKNFQYIPCAIMEIDVTPLEIDEIENALQIQKENKLDYTWTNELLKIKREKIRREQIGNISQQNIIEQIKNSMGLKDVKEVQFKLRMLDLVDGYLLDTSTKEINNQNNYLIASDFEQIVTEFQKKIDKSKSPQEQEAMKTIAYQLMKRSKGFGDRAFSYRELLDPKNFRKVQEHLVKKITGGNKSIETIYKERKKETLTGGSDILEEFVSDFQSADEQTGILDDIIKEEMKYDDESFTGAFNIREVINVEQGKISHIKNIRSLDKIKITEVNYHNLDKNVQAQVYKKLIQIEKICKD